MDIKAISKTGINKLKVEILGKSKYGNAHWQKADQAWYDQMHSKNPLHKDFKKYLNSKTDVQTILEIGCGTGVYPIKNKQLFDGKKYTGIDFSKPNIDFCKSHSDFEFISGDFNKMELNERYDLVYSHAVIDHVYDIDNFLKKIVLLSKKHAYISAYRGYFPNLKSHKMNWSDPDRCYYSDVSIPQTIRVLLDSGLSEEEFVIKKMDNNKDGNERWVQTVIMITKSSYGTHHRNPTRD